MHACKIASTVPVANVHNPLNKSSIIVSNAALTLDFDQNMPDKFDCLKCILTFIITVTVTEK